MSLPAISKRMASSAAATRLGYNIVRKGRINASGINAASKKVVEELLLKDAEEHHCYFRASGLHNHLSHHLLAAYDLGAAASHIKKIYDGDAPAQRPIILDPKDKDIIVDDNNWVQYLGNQSAYGAFVKFFSGKIQELGPGGALERFVFERSVNEPGKTMLIRVMSGAVHPFIQIGYGVEFGNDTLVATGLAQAAIHNPTAPQVYNLTFSEGKSDGPGPTVLEVLKEVYDSEILHPVMPYDPDAFINARLKAVAEPERAEEIRRLVSTFHIDPKAGPEEYASKAEEMIWVSTLLFAGTGKRDRKPRLDFFLMHLVTSSLFVNPMLRILDNPVSKANLLRSFLSVVILLTLARGRPRIDPDLLMSYTATPRPPGTSLNPSKSALGSPLDDADYNPWPAILEDVIYHPDPHVLKTLRSLLSAAREYGATPAGGAIGSFIPGAAVEETHRGTGSMDGTVFVRAAGLLMDYMGWVANGQEARPDWDRSALGWDAAWDKDVD